jgi:hypothetical protein
MALRQAPFEPTDTGITTYTAVQELSAKSDAQRLLKARAVEVLNDLVQTPLLLFAPGDNSIPTPFLAVLVFWLGIIFASFSLFSRVNPTLPDPDHRPTGFCLVGFRGDFPDSRTRAPLCWLDSVFRRTTP